MAGGKFVLAWLPTLAAAAELREVQLPIPADEASRRQGMDLEQRFLLDYWKSGCWFEWADLADVKCFATKSLR